MVGKRLKFGVIAFVVIFAVYVFGVLYINKPKVDSNEVVVAEMVPAPIGVAVGESFTTNQTHIPRVRLVESIVINNSRISIIAIDDVEYLLNEDGGIIKLDKKE